MEYYINYGECETGIKPQFVEQKMNAKYIGDFCIKTKNGSWSEQPLSIFYQETPSKPEYSNYFGLYRNVFKDSWMIADGSSAFSEPITAIVGSDGEVLYSRYRHDFRTLKTNEGCVDGGRDYFRCLGSIADENNVSTMPKVVELVIEKDKLVIKQS